MVIFGASGDLTKRKLIPALYNLAKDRLLSQEFALIGFAKNAFTTDEFRDKISEEIKQFAEHRSRCRPVALVRPAHLLHLRRLQRPGEVSRN